MAPTMSKKIILQGLAQLLQDSGDLILDGTSTLTLFTSTLQILTQIFEQHLLPRNQNHGFIALSSHPAETSAILQAQFVFDVLQKTLSLKLINVPNTFVSAAVKISPFKSLRRLELRCVPLHCLQGLRFVYSQLEALTCSRCVNSLEEILSACGGDLSSALPWLELQTVNFSYNTISALDDSLQLLNVLKALDLSHNLIQDCENYLTVLTELEYLNMAYNFLPKVPELGLHSRAKLLTLILRYNHLDNINGVEQLPNLQHLDIAYNLLLEHTVLAPLALLHNMRRLHLEGNPLWFHPDHQLATIMHLSPRAVSCNLLLDEEPLSVSSLQHHSKLNPAIAQQLCTPASERTLTNRNALESSYAADQSDSQSPIESTSARLSSRKRTKGKIKVRKASISEPSDTEHDYGTPPFTAGLVQQLQAEVERMDNVRDRFGANWLQYRRHLEEDVPGGSVTHSSSPTGDSLGSSGGTSEKSKNPMQEQKISSTAEGKELKLSAPEIGVESPKASSEKDRSTSKEDKDQEEIQEVDLCQPILVSQIEGDGDPEPDWIFLRVTAQHIVEVELIAAKVLHRLELQSLQSVETSEMRWRRKDLVREFPVLTLCFNYIRKDRQKRRYVVLDDHPEQHLQDLLRVLEPTLEKNRKSKGLAEGPKVQCLKCKQEFPGSQWKKWGSAKETITFSEQDVAASGETIICPGCSSDHVVILPCEKHSSTEMLSQDCFDESQQESESGKFYIGDDNNSETGTNSSTQIQELSGDQGSSAHSSSHSSEGVDATRRDLSSKGQCSSLSRTDTNGGSLMGSYHYGISRGPTPSQLSLSSDHEEHWNLSPPTNHMLEMRDLFSVDHRLKLYLDMEIFEKAEEFKCFLKVAVVKNGQPGEFLVLLVASDLKLHVLKVTGEIRGQPSSWLKKGDCHYLSDLSCLEVGLCHQSLHMEFLNPCISYTLLVRNQSRCRRYLQCLKYLIEELPTKSRRKIPDVTVVEMNPQHPLWRLINKDLEREAADGSARPFFYLLTYLIQGSSAFPVTLLITHSNIFLVEEDHQWQRALPSSDPGSCVEKQPKDCIRLKANEPISSISGVILYRFSPFDVKLQLYDEVLKVETTWHLRTECPDLLADLVQWLRVPWEEMFSIALPTTVLEVLE